MLEAKAGVDGSKKISSEIFNTIDLHYFFIHFIRVTFKNKQQYINFFYKDFFCGNHLTVPTLVDSFRTGNRNFKGGKLF